MSKSQKLREYLLSNKFFTNQESPKTLSNIFNIDLSLVYKIRKEVSSQENISNTITNEEEFINVADLSDKNSLLEYCETYNIPFEYVKSAKFINHQGQSAWNIVCDMDRINSKDIEINLEKFESFLKESVVPVKLNYDNDIDQKVAYHFYFSDKHVGAKTPSNALYKNAYGPEEFERRMFLGLEDYIEESKLYGRYDKVVLGDFGDALDGWNGKTTRNSNHNLPQNLNNKEAFNTYVEVMIKYIDTLIGLDLSNEYEILSVTNDNHSGDFGYIVNRAIEIYINVKYPDVKTRLLEKFIETYDYGVHTFMFTHGKDDEDMKHGMPYKLDLKTESYINDFIINHNLLGKYLHFIKGDLHQESSCYGKQFRYRNVLSLYGSSKWIMTNFGNNLPGISAEIVYKNKNKIIPLIKRIED